MVATPVAAGLAALPDAGTALPDADGAPAADALPPAGAGVLVALMARICTACWLAAAAGGAPPEPHAASMMGATHQAAIEVNPALKMEPSPAAAGEGLVRART